ncbi:hypothetical protein CCYA_CCYA04G1413 [Cyanidiococcus yangmingshanensis]|nr:hypothetical protein CCYA_CCYA04G1413 [Cyanidiococcus yangmingshanensis]
MERTGASDVVSIDRDVDSDTHREADALANESSVYAKVRTFFAVLGELFAELNASLKSFIHFLEEKGVVGLEGATSKVNRNYNLLQSLNDRVRVCVLASTALETNLREAGLCQQLERVVVPVGLVVRIRQLQRTWHLLFRCMATTIAQLAHEGWLLITQREQESKALERIYRKHVIICTKEAALLEHIQRVHVGLFAHKEHDRSTTRDQALTHSVMLTERYQRLCREHAHLQRRFASLVEEWRRVNDNRNDKPFGVHGPGDRLERFHGWATRDSTPWPRRNALVNTRVGSGSDARATPWSVSSFVRSSLQRDQIAAQSLELELDTRDGVAGWSLPMDPEEPPVRSLSAATGLHALVASLKADAYRYGVTPERG